MKALKTAFKAQKLLKRKAMELGLEQIQMKLLDYVEPYIQKEDDGKTYKYPETVEIKFENWNNKFFSFRVADCRWIKEGTDLNGRGFSTYQVMRWQLKELKAYSEFLNPPKIQDQIEKSLKKIYQLK